MQRWILDTHNRESGWFRGKKKSDAKASGVINPKIALNRRDAVRRELCFESCWLAFVC
jgi:hypothetical protein